MHKKLLTLAATLLAMSLPAFAESSSKESAYDLKAAAEFYEAELAYKESPYGVNDANKRKDDNTVVVDVRAKEVYAKGHVPGAINWPRDQWDSVKLDKDKTYVFYCYTATCRLAARATLHFIKKGFKAKEMSGGWTTWTAENYPVEK